MKLFLAGVCAVVFSISTQAQELPHKGYIVKFKNAVNSRSLHALASQGIRVKSVIPEINAVTVDMKVNQLSALDAFSDSIEYVEPNYLVRLIEDKPTGGGDDGLPAGWNLWGHKAIHAKEAWDIAKGNKSILIAVSDTGVWSLHFDLEGQMYRNPGETGVDSNGQDKSKNKVDDDGNGFVDDFSGWNFETNYNNAIDDHYHGTHVAGTIGASPNNSGVVGVGYDVSILPVKFLGKDGYGTTEGGLKTIIYAANMGAKAVNCSWGGDGYSQALYDAIEYAKSKGTLVVAAAGNDESDNDKNPTYPAAYTNDNMITVAASQTSEHIVAFFSNWGATSVHVAAPGHNITSTFNPTYSILHRTWFMDLSGTSMAAPHVSGVVALVYAANPNLTYSQVKSIIIETVTKSSHWDGKIVSGGVVNALEAVRRAKSLL